MHTIVVHGRHVTRLPLVPHTVVYFRPFAIDDVKEGFIDMTMLLRDATRTVLLKMDVQRLAQTVLRFDVVPAVCLRSVDKGNLSLPFLTRGWERRRFSSSPRLY